MQDYKSTLVLKAETHPKYLVLIFDGALDKAGLDETRDQIEKEVENVKVDIVALDFTKLNFINSEAIGLLLTLHTRLVKKNKKLALYGAADHVLDVLNVIGLLKVISSYPSGEAMIEDLKLS